MIKADLHCHTLASAHAYSTVFELLQFAKQRNLSVLAVTDHAPNMPDSSHLWHFKNLRTLPRQYDGVTILRGVEANILDFEAQLDIPEPILKKLEWVIASFHEDAYEGGTLQQNTQAWICAAQNPYVDMIGHPDRLPFVFDHGKAIRAFKEYEKVVEINNHSFQMKKWKKENLVDIILTCKKYDVLLSVNSDAHTCFDVGLVDNALQILDELGYQKDLILNFEPDRILEMIQKKRNIKL